MMLQEHDNRSIGELIAELSRETSTLVRKELELARVEMADKAREAATDAGLSTAGGVLAHAGMLVLLAAIVIGLTTLGLAAWLSALIVAVIAIAVGATLVSRGVSRLKRMSLAPRQTIDTLKEDAKWTKHQRA